MSMTVSKLTSPRSASGAGGSGAGGSGAGGSAASSPASPAGGPKYDIYAKRRPLLDMATACAGMPPSAFALDTSPSPVVMELACKCQGLKTKLLGCVVLECPLLPPRATHVTASVLLCGLLWLLLFFCVWLLCVCDWCVWLRYAEIRGTWW